MSLDAGSYSCKVTVCDRGGFKEHTHTHTLESQSASGRTLAKISRISSDTSIFPEFRLTGVYPDIIELELKPACLPHSATLSL